MSKTMTIASLVLALVLSALPASAASALEPGQLDESLFGLRLKDFTNGGDRGMYLGVPDLGIAANRSEIDFQAYGAAQDVTLTYDGDRALQLTVTRENVTRTVSYTLAGAPAELNALQVFTRDSAAGSTTTLADITVTTAAGSVVVGTAAGNGVTSRATGLDLADGFTMTAILRIGAEGARARNENQKVDVLFGTVAPPTPETKEDCKKDGWMNHTDDKGTPFANQGDCVSWVATGGENPAAG